MVGGGSNKRDDGLPAISSANIFSALESRRRKSNKKTRSEKEKNEVPKKVGEGDKLASPQVWTAAPVSVSSWADCEEDDDEYFALPALPPIVDESSSSVHDAPSDSREDLSQDESEGDDEMDEDLEEENEEEQETEASKVEVSTKFPSTPVITPTAREPDRQLSKKELKKKELAELDAVLAELGLNPKDEKDSIEEEHENGAIDDQTDILVTSGPVLTESKSSKRRKAKKDKPLQKEEKEDESTHEQLEAIISKEETSVENTEKELNLVTSDPKELLKKLASMKKKKSFKESDGAAKAAAAEAAARAAKLASSKKKEKSHYNQQPVR